MFSSETLNIIGLSFDILGVILLFFYEPPKPEPGAILLESAPSEQERAASAKAKYRLSRVALLLIIIGFIIQIISNLI